MEQQVRQLEQRLDSRSPAMAVFCRAAVRMGLEVEVVDPTYRVLLRIRHGGRSKLLLGSRSPLNDAVAARICQDKVYTARVLHQAGFVVPTTVSCLKPGHFQLSDYSEHEGVAAGLAFAEAHGYPVVVKPNRLSHGRHVQVVESKSELLAAIDEVWARDYLALVQTPVAGVDLRLDYLDGQFLTGYSRAPSSQPRADGFDILNLAQGAHATVIESIPQSWVEQGTRIGAALGVRHFGIDFRVPRVGNALGSELHRDLLATDPQKAHILEVNASPLLGRMWQQGYCEQAVGAQIRVLQAILERD
ncbi:MAG: ATP-grasp domain-containing protein [Nannocystaceae bacterium]